MQQSSDPTVQQELTEIKEVMDFFDTPDQTEKKEVKELPPIEKHSSYHRPLPYSMGEIMDYKLPPVEFIWDGFLKKTLGLLASPGATGKSTLIIEFFASLVSDKHNFLEYNYNKLKEDECVLYINTEDPAEVILNKYDNILRDMDIDQGDRDKIKYIPASGYDFKLYTDSMEPATIERVNRNYEYIEYLIAEYKPKLIVLDTLVRFFGGSDENSNVQASDFYNKLEALCHNNDLNILLVHHFNKAGAVTANSEQTSMRGASAFVDNARYSITLRTMSEKDTDKFNIEIAERRQWVYMDLPKVNYAPSNLTEIWLKRLTHGRLVRTTPPLKPQGASNGRQQF